MNCHCEEATLTKQSILILDCRASFHFARNDNNPQKSLHNYLPMPFHLLRANRKAPQGRRLLGGHRFNLEARTHIATHNPSALELKDHQSC